MFCITILAPEPPTFALKNAFRPCHQLFKNNDNVHGLEIQKIKDLRIKRMRTEQICRARSCRYAHIKIFNDGPATDAKPIVHYCIFIVGWHELPPKTYRSLRTQQLAFSRSHTQPARPTARPEWTGYLTAR